MGFGLFIAIVGLVISAFSAGSSAFEAQKAKTKSGKEGDARRKVAASEARAAHVREQRNLRLQRAKISAGQAASGSIGSAQLGSSIALGTAAQANQQAIAEGLSITNQQISLGEQQTVDQANAQIGQAIGSFAATAITPTGQDQLSPVERILK